MCHPVCTLHGAERLTHPLEPPCPKPQAPTSSNSSLASRRVETSNFPPPPAVPPFPFCISMVVVVGGKGGGQPPTTGLGLRGAPPFYLAIPPPPSSSSWEDREGGVCGKYPPSGAPPAPAVGWREQGHPALLLSGFTLDRGRVQGGGGLPSLSRGAEGLLFD